MLSPIFQSYDLGMIWAEECRSNNPILSNWIEWFEIKWAVEMNWFKLDNLRMNKQFWAQKPRLIWLFRSKTFKDYWAETNHLICEEIVNPCLKLRIRSRESWIQTNHLSWECITEMKWNEMIRNCRDFSAGQRSVCIWSFVHFRAQKWWIVNDASRLIIFPHFTKDLLLKWASWAQGWGCSFHASPYVLL